MKALIVEYEMVSRAKMHMVMSDYEVCDMVVNGTEAFEKLEQGLQQQAPSVSLRRKPWLANNFRG